MLLRKNPNRGRLGSFATGGLLILLGPMILNWSWNKVAVELFALPPSKYSHGVAVIGAIAIVIMTYQALRVFSRDGKHGHEEP